MNMPLPKQVAPANEVIYQDLSGECVLLNMANEKYYGLDDVGAKMWQVLAEDGNTATMLGKLQAYYAVDATTLQQDLAELIAKLQHEGLVRVTA